MVDLTKYWVMAQVVSKIFVTPDGQTLWESQVNAPAANSLPAITMTEVDKTGNFYAAWYLAVDPQLGVIEYADRYPFGTYVFKPGQMVRWGTTTMNVGDTLQGVSQVDCSKSPCSSNGWGYYYSQLLAMIPEFDTPAGTYLDVAEMGSWQSWCVDVRCSQQQVSNAVWYLAKGIGIIGVDVCNPPGSGQCQPTYRLAAVVTTTQ
jgi:hypothetical protein